MIGEIISDFQRYTSLHKNFKWYYWSLVFFHNPGMFFSILYRIEHNLISNKITILRFIVHLLHPLYFIITYFILDIDIDPSVVIGKGFYVHNKGIIISSTASIGNNCTILGPTTIGINLNGNKAPKINNHVTICTGARIIGDIHIGNNVIVGANAVVVKSFSSNVIIGGIPAKILKKNI